MSWTQLLKTVDQVQQTKTKRPLPDDSDRHDVRRALRRKVEDQFVEHTAIAIMSHSKGETSDARASVNAHPSSDKEQESDWEVQGYYGEFID